MIISVFRYSYPPSSSSGVFPQDNEYPCHIRPVNSSVDPSVDYLERALNGLRPLGVDAAQVMEQLITGEGFEGSLRFMGIPSPSPSGAHRCRQ